MERTIVSVMEKEALRFQPTRKVLGLVQGTTQRICGKHIPDLSDRPEDAQMFANFFGGTFTEIKA